MVDMSHSSYWILSPWNIILIETVKRRQIRIPLATAMDIWSYLSA
jgi:hypothetical protein